ncbi:uncharacterized protein LOC112268645 [Brachypodium distachyon]|uniref:uncharacterized protein LOC112268645 n=1 Tax=Brachypodium distachyon TaxID=15368 RepID=UPI000D0CF241|nr:uncharacterized protein LOC112268645 [Brachypodium distachyon]|eukprot:XP_024310325.1 uncharacterized protein LOC112268645 [Brachypodium distachyon]
MPPFTSFCPNPCFSSMANIDLNQPALLWDEIEDYSGPVIDLNYDLKWVSDGEDEPEATGQEHGGGLGASDCVMGDGEGGSRNVGVGHGRGTLSVSSERCGTLGGATLSLAGSNNATPRHGGRGHPRLGLTGLGHVVPGCSRGNLSLDTPHGLASHGRGATSWRRQPQLRRARTKEPAMIMKILMAMAMQTKEKKASKRFLRQCSFFMWMDSYVEKLQIEGKLQGHEMEEQRMERADENNGKAELLFLEEQTDMAMPE